MSLTDDKVKKLDAQIEFLAAEETALRRRTETWALGKMAKFSQVRESLTEYRRALVKGTML